MLAALSIGLLDGLLLALLTREPVPELLANMLLARQLLVLMKLGLTAVGFIVLLRWLRRAYYNLHQVAGSYPGYPDNWAIWAWFIPIVNIIRPLTIMREVWYGTQRAAHQAVVPATLLGWWWATYLGDSLLAVVIVGVSAKYASSTATLAGELISQVSSLLPAFLIWYAVRRIAKFEQALAYQAGPGAPGKTPTSKFDDSSTY